ncbi:MAG: SUMF1/EgtB/PvdO family nonheme iron enzyme, partial [Candidatus Tectomicrobia bacterium]|nr:SUMF1/EgtB/PvdO family nonheme iron enzyme [Candidatus Tectomicrobia bacterium]
MKATVIVFILVVLMCGGQAGAQDLPADILPVLQANPDVVLPMVRVEGGSFTMGCKSERDSDCDDDEVPVHQVSLRSFEIGRHEVTQALWEAVMGDSPSAFGGCPRCPLERVHWDAGRGLLGRPSVDFRPHAFEGNLLIEARKREANEDFSRGTLVGGLADNFGNGFSNFFPAWLRGDGLGSDEAILQRRPNLSGAARRYLNQIGLGVEELFHHVLAVPHDPAYRKPNAGALRMEWPRIPLPGWPDGEDIGAMEALLKSATYGRQLAALLDPGRPVPGVTQAPFRREMAAIAVPATYDGSNMSGEDFSITSGWGHFGAGKAVMPGQGHIIERDFLPMERGLLSDVLSILSPPTYDVYLNARTFWRNVPSAVWDYRLGGYQVLKKWLSYW